VECPVQGVETTSRIARRPSRSGYRVECPVQGVETRATSSRSAPSKVTEWNAQYRALKPSVVQTTAPFAISYRVECPVQGVETRSGAYVPPVTVCYRVECPVQGVETCCRPSQPLSPARYRVECPVQGVETTTGRGWRKPTSAVTEWNAQYRALKPPKNTLVLAEQPVTEWNAQYRALKPSWLMNEALIPRLQSGMPSTGR